MKDGVSPGNCVVCLSPIEGESAKFTQMGCCSATLCGDCFVQNFSRTQKCPGCRTPLTETRRASGLCPRRPLTVVTLEGFLSESGIIDRLLNQDLDAVLPLFEEHLDQISRAEPSLLFFRPPRARWIADVRRIPRSVGAPNVQGNNPDRQEN